MKKLLLKEKKTVLLWTVELLRLSNFANNLNSQ